MIIIGIVLFSELIIINSGRIYGDYFFQRNIENHELLRAALERNNSLAYFDCFLTYSSVDCLKAFNDSIKESFENYLPGKNYELDFCGLRYSSNSGEKCFKKAAPYYINISLPGKSCEVYFSIYLDSEVINCA